MNGHTDKPIAAPSKALALLKSKHHGKKKKGMGMGMGMGMEEMFYGTETQRISTNTNTITSSSATKIAAGSKTKMVVQWICQSKCCRHDPRLENCLMFRVCLC